MAGKKKGFTEKEARYKEEEILAGRQKALQIKDESQRRRNFCGKTVDEKEARDKEETILAAKIR